MIPETERKQRPHNLAIGILIVLILAVCPNIKGADQDGASPKLSLENGAGAHTTGKYRNLFLEAGYSPQDPPKFRAPMNSSFTATSKPYGCTSQAAGTKTDRLPTFRTSSTTTCVPKGCPTA